MEGTTYVNVDKYISRITSSARGEVFNPLIYPFLLTTFAYGLGFLIPLKAIVGESALFDTMVQIDPRMPYIWGLVAITTVLMGATFLIFNIPPAGSYSGLLGFMVWLFVAILYVGNGDYLILVAIALPNAFFWIWQFLSLSRFNREDAADAKTMNIYNAGGYDDKLHLAQGKIDREDNRGRDVQSYGSYDKPDSGRDSSREIDKEQ